MYLSLCCKPLTNNTWTMFTSPNVHENFIGGYDWHLVNRNRWLMQIDQVCFSFWVWFTLHDGVIWNIGLPIYRTSRDCAHCIVFVVLDSELLVFLNFAHILVDCLTGTLTFAVCQNILIIYGPNTRKYLHNFQQIIFIGADLCDVITYILLRWSWYGIW